MNTPPPTSGPMLIDARAACAMLAIGEKRLWTLTNARAIPHRRIGRSVRYSPVELARWIDAGCPTTPGAGEELREVAR